MNATVVEFSPKLRRTVHVCASIGAALAINPPELFRRAEMLVIDGVPWRADFGIIRSALNPKRRKRKDRWSELPITPDVEAEIERVKAQLEEIFAWLYYGFEPIARLSSFRPMITEAEPMHFDTKITANPLVVSFVNIAPTPRQYGIGPTFYEVQPALLREMWREARRLGHLDVSFVARRRGAKKLPPLGQSEPKHAVSFAPGAVWFFDAKMMSHEVIYGEGIIAMAWEVLGSGARQQPELLAALERAA